MGGRYLVTGAQLGTLIALCKLNADGCNKLLNEITETQFIGESDELLINDLKKCCGCVMNVEIN